MAGTESEKPKRIDVARERAEAANCVIADLTRNGLPKEIAHDLLIAYAKAIEGHCTNVRSAQLLGALLSGISHRCQSIS